MMCPKAKAACLAVLRDAEASFWDREEAKAYLEAEAIVPVLWVSGKGTIWQVECGDAVWITCNPTRVFCNWLREVLAGA